MEGLAGQGSFEFGFCHFCVLVGLFTELSAPLSVTCVFPVLGHRLVLCLLGA